LDSNSSQLHSTDTCLKESLTCSPPAFLIISDLTGPAGRVNRQEHAGFELQLHARRVEERVYAHFKAEFLPETLVVWPGLWRGNFGGNAIQFVRSADF
jgi:hypothetical protein